MERADKKVSFTITEGCNIKNIKSAEGIEETTFLPDFNDTNLKWQFTGALFGKGSALISLEEESFTILIKDGKTIMPNILVTEVFHNKVRFNRLKSNI